MKSFEVVLFIFELLALIVFLVKHRIFSIDYKLFLFIVLASTVITEGIGLSFVFLEKEGFNIHHFYMIILFNAIYFFYKAIIKSKRITMIMTILTIAFTFLWSLSFLSSWIYSNILILGSLNTSIFAFFYLRELLVSDDIINYKKLLPFWVTISFLIFYLSSIPFFFILKYMNDRSLYYILYTLGIVMYSGIIFGLIWSNKEQKYL